MSIEAMKRIKSLLQDTDKIDSHTISAVVAECDMVILAQQPATPEPALFIHPDTFAMNSAHVGAWKPGHELTSYIPLYTHPAPSVPDGVVRDAERCRFILAAADDMTTSRYKSLCELLGVAITEDFDLGVAIDAAQKGANGEIS